MICDFFLNGYSLELGLDSFRVSIMKIHKNIFRNIVKINWSHTSAL